MREPIEGFGHPHHDVDPRVPLLLDISRRNGVYGDHCLLECIEDKFAAAVGRRIAANIDGVSAALFSDLHLDPRLARPILMAPRSLSLAAHFLEEEDQNRNGATSPTAKSPIPALNRQRWKARRPAGRGCSRGRDRRGVTVPVDRVEAMFRDALPAGGGGTLQERREGYEAMLARLPIPDGAAITAGTYGGVEGFWVQAAGASSGRVGVMFHGGGYIIGSAKGYRAYAAEVSRVTNARVFVAEYRLAPEQPFPAAIEDAEVCSLPRWMRWDGVVFCDRRLRWRWVGAQRTVGTAPRGWTVAGVHRACLGAGRLDGHERQLRRARPR